MFAATFGNVHGAYKPGAVKLRPDILKLGQDAVIGVGAQQSFDDGLFACVVDLGDEVVDLLLRDANGFHIQRRAVDDRTSGSGGLDGHVEHGVQVGGRHELLSLWDRSVTLPPSD